MTDTPAQTSPPTQTADVPAGQGGEGGAGKPTGRPSLYSAELAKAICERIASGESLRRICADPAMPAASTVFLWLAQHKEFSEQYARAREAQAEALFEQCLEIADDGSGDLSERTTPDGNVITSVDHEHISRSKLRVDTRKWMAGKLAPKKYGDKVALEHSGDKDNPIITRVERAIVKSPHTDR